MISFSFALYCSQLHIVLIKSLKKNYLKKKEKNKHTKERNLTKLYDKILHSVFGVYDYQLGTSWT